MSSDFLIQALVFIGAAIVFVPIAKKLKLSSVLGYLIAGIIIGPFVLGLVGGEGSDIMHAAEFGVVLMLFLIGLELDPKKFWEMRKAITGMGTMQMAGTSVLLIFIFIAIGWNWQTSVAVALAFSMSSTAIVLQTLKEKQLLRTSAGESSFSVLLFQDIAVIPILALLPLLEPAGLKNSGAAGGSLFAGQPAWVQILIILLAVISILVSGRFLAVPFLRFVSRAGLRELFTASSLFIVIGVAALMQLVGLSPALGTFVAGVVLANSEFRHELESDIDPFKGLLLGLFFLSVGSTINFDLIISDPDFIITIALVVIAIKFAVLFAIGKFFKLSQDQNFLFAFGLSQIGEFAFVLLSFSNQINIIDKELNSKLLAIVAITMTITPLLLLINEKLIDPYFGTKTLEDEDEMDIIDTKQKVIIAGFGHFGSTIGRLLRANKIEATILDNDSDRVSLLRKMGFKVYYGDATRLDLLSSAGADEAKLLIAAIDSPEVNLELIRMVKKHFPNLKIMARARNRYDAYELIETGVQHIYRETLYTAVNLGIDALTELGFRKYTARKQGLNFIKYDERALQKLADSRHDTKEYIINVKEEIEMQEQILQNDLQQNLESTDISWDSERVKEELGIRE